MRFQVFAGTVLLALTVAAARADDVESLHIINMNLDLRPGWTMQLHSRVRTFENISAFNQLRLGPILMTQVRPRVLALAGYYYIDQNRRVVYQDFHIHRAWTGAQVRAAQRRYWSVDARSLVERFISSEFTDYFRFRNRAFLNLHPRRGLMPFASAEALRQQNIWYGRYTAGVQWRAGLRGLMSVSYEYRPSPIGAPSHILATMLQFDTNRLTPPHID